MARGRYTIGSLGLTVLVAAVGCQTAPTGSVVPTASAVAPPREGPSVASSPTPASPAPSGSTAPQPAAAAAPSASAAPSGPCPADMALAGRTCVDRYEAHLVRLDPNGAETPHSPFERPQAGVRYVARSTAGVTPQAYINRLESQAACEEAGKRLCTVREWYRTCTGAAGTQYPYGIDFVKGRCNTLKPHVLSRLHGNDPARWKYDEDFNDPKLNQEPGFLALTGAYAGCVTDAGVFDMVGNLHEWVSDRVDEELPGKVPLRDDIRAKIGKNTGHGIFMGGFYSTSGEHGRGCGFLTPGHEPKYHDYSTGFRCCRDPDGSSAPGSTP